MNRDLAFLPPSAPSGNAPKVDEAEHVEAAFPLRPSGRPAPRFHEGIENWVIVSCWEETLAVHLGLSGLAMSVRSEPSVKKGEPCLHSGG